MEQLTKQEIRQSIILDLEKAWDNPQEATYWLEKLPMWEDYDYEVHEFIKKFTSSIRSNDREIFDIYIDELVDMYFHNQEGYNFD